MTTILGNSSYSSSGGFGSAKNATIKSPVGLWGDSIGILYVGDSNSFLIRAINLATGIIKPFAGKCLRLRYKLSKHIVVIAFKFNLSVSIALDFFLSIRICICSNSSFG